MKVRPKLAYKLLGTTVELDPNKVYKASKATNLPNEGREGLIWCGDMLLEKGEYEIVEP